MRRLLVCAGILGGAIPVFAQTSPQSSFTESVVVTASLAEETASDLPAAVSIVDAEELAHLADEAMYSAKRAGRDHVHAA